MPQRWRNGPGIGTDGRFHNSGYNLGHVPFKPAISAAPHRQGFIPWTGAGGSPV